MDRKRQGENTQSDVRTKTGEKTRSFGVEITESCRCSAIQTFIRARVGICKFNKTKSIRINKVAVPINSMVAVLVVLPILHFSDVTLILSFRHVFVRLCTIGGPVSEFVHSKQCFIF